jgi:hypothetical protein
MKEREEILKKEQIADERPGQRDGISGIHFQAILDFLTFFSSVFICVHLWFQPIYPTEAS